MRKKGITPVIAIVLLITVTVAAAGAVVQYLEVIEEIGGDVDADDITDSIYLSYESCWEGQGNDYNMQFRHNHPRDAIDTEEYLILVNGRMPDYSYENGQESVIVDPEETFILELNEGNEVDNLETPFTVEVISGSERERFTCTTR